MTQDEHFLLSRNAGKTWVEYYVVQPFVGGQMVAPVGKKSVHSLFTVTPEEMVKYLAGQVAEAKLDKKTVTMKRKPRGTW